MCNFREETKKICRNIALRRDFFKFHQIANKREKSLNYQNSLLKYAFYLYILFVNVLSVLTLH